MVCVVLQKKVIEALFTALLACSAGVTFLSFRSFVLQQQQQQSQSHPPPTTTDYSWIDVHLSTFLIRSRNARTSATTTTSQEALKQAQPHRQVVPSISTLANRFYKHHRENIHRLVNESTALDWDARSKTPFGPFKDHLGEEPYVVPWKVGPEFEWPQLNNTATTRYIVWRDICLAAKAFLRDKNNDNSNDESTPQQRLDHVLILRLNENWGEFSTYIPNRTTNRGSMLTGENAWNKKGCTRQDIETYLNTPELKAAITTQHQLLNHPKVYSLPLGVKSRNPDLKKLLQTLNESNSMNNHSESDSYSYYQSRPQLLMVNSGPKPWRGPLLDMVVNNFNGTIHNTFEKKGYRSYQIYLDEMRRSKFILSPSGQGLDCYRHWEAIHMGTIPVLEHLNRTNTDGWYRTLADLPVAWIDNYSNLTPEWLEKKYFEIVSKPNDYNYQKLTRQWWIQLIQTTLQLQSSS